MQTADADRAAAAVSASIAQLLDVFAGNVISALDVPEDALAKAFEVCKQAHFPAAAASSGGLPVVAPVVAQTPVPALGKGLGELPRFRSELGPFLGLSTALRAGALSGGFGTAQTDVSSIGGLDASVRFGIGLEGVLNESSDGLAFAEVGIREDTHASGTVSVPARGALTSRFRAPFWLIPGDLVVAAPILSVTSKKTLMKMAIQAANGGLIPWQTRHRHARWALSIRVRAGGRPELLSQWFRSPVSHSNVWRAASQRYPGVLELSAGGISYSRIPAVSNFFYGPKLRLDDPALHWF